MKTSSIIPVVVSELSSKIKELLQKDRNSLTVEEIEFLAVHMKSLPKLVDKGVGIGYFNP